MRTARKPLVGLRVVGARHTSSQGDAHSDAYAPKMAPAAAIGEITAAAAADPAGARRLRTRLPRGRTCRTLFVDSEAGQEVDAPPGHTSAFCAAWRRDHPGAESIQWVLKVVHKPMLGTVRRWDACRDWPSSSCGRVACSLAWPWSTPSTFRTFRALVILGSAGRVRTGRRAVGAVEPSSSLRPHEERITVRPGPSLSLRRRARARWHALDRGPPETK